MSTRSIAAAAMAALVALISAAAASCGGSDADPFCGDGKHQPETGEECDDGNDIDNDACTNSCRAILPDSTTIKWVFNPDAAPGFDSDACSDVRAFMVEVSVTGPATETMVEQCSLRQVVFQNLPAGTYTVTATPLDLNGESLVNAPGQIEADLGPNIEATVPVHPDAWLRSYTGSFIFRTEWGGEDCADAVPPVRYQRLTMMQRGSPVTVSTENGTPLNGSAEGDCLAADPTVEQFPQSALMVPFGAATFTVEGLDAARDVQFSETFDTFVGAGISNPELVFDVASTAPDAGVPDAF